MKPRVLFITSPQEDYLQDSVLIGMRNLLGKDAVDLPRKHSLYEDEPRAREQAAVRTRLHDLEDFDHFRRAKAPLQVRRAHMRC